jgi:outer membrane protein assembly factor BamA
LILQVVGQEWIGHYMLLDDDMLVVRLPRVGENVARFDTFVLERPSNKSNETSPPPATVTASTTPQTKEERQITVGRIVITGNTQTSDAAILKAFKIAPGERVTYSMLREAAERLKGMGIKVALAVHEANDATDVVIRVNEAKAK